MGGMEGCRLQLLGGTALTNQRAIARLRKRRHPSMPPMRPRG